jgi:hypothetical protein
MVNPTLDNYQKKRGHFIIKGSHICMDDHGFKNPITDFDI